MSDFLAALLTIFILLCCLEVARWLAAAYDNRHRTFFEQHDQVWWGDRSSFQRWQARHPYKPRRFPSPRHTRMKRNGGSHTEAEWHALCARYRWRCLCCQQKKPLTKDHIIPIVVGGRDSIDNLQPLCKSCNSRKGTRTIDYRSRR